MIHYHITAEFNIEGTYEPIECESNYDYETRANDFAAQDMMEYIADPVEFVLENDLVDDPQSFIDIVGVDFVPKVFMRPKGFKQ